MVGNSCSGSIPEQKGGGNSGRGLSDEESLSLRAWRMSSATPDGEPRWGPAGLLAWRDSSQRRCRRRRMRQKRAGETGARAQIAFLPPAPEVLLPADPVPVLAGLT